MRHKPSPFWLELLTIVTVYLILLLGEWLGPVQTITTAFEKLLQPAVIKVSQGVMFVSQPATLIKQSFKSASRVQELEREYSYSLAKIAELEHLQVENEQLRQLLKAKTKSKSAVVAVPIVSRGQPSISAGLEDGIAVGQPVLVAKTIVGLIASTSDHQAVVNLLFQNDNQPILVKTSGGVEGLVIGDGKNILLTEIDKEAQLLVGDLVVTIGQEQLPPQLVIGRVGQVIDQPSAPVKTAILKQEVSFYEASAVEVSP